jgi:tetratricopeptide (TPR) repeat protein
MLCVKFDTLADNMPMITMRRICLVTFLLVFSLAGTSHGASARSDPPEYVKADRLFSQGRYAEAIPLYTSALSSSSRRPSAGVLHTRIADCFFHMNDYQRALAAYRMALTDQELAERAQTQYWIGFCTFLLGRNAESITEFLKIPEAYPSSGMWVNTAYYWAGRASERMGRKDQAIELYRKAGGKGTSTQGRFALKKANAIKRKDSEK